MAISVGDGEKQNVPAGIPARFPAWGKWKRENQNTETPKHQNPPGLAGLLSAQDGPQRHRR